MVTLQFTAFDSIAHTMHMPFVNWQIPTAMQGAVGVSDFAVSVRPPNDEVLADLIIAKDWRNVTYLHDGGDCE